MSATGHKYIMRDRIGFKVRFAIAHGQRIYKNFPDLESAIRWRNQQLDHFGLLDRLAYEKAPDYFKAKKQYPIIGVYKNFNHDRVNWVAIVGPAKKRSFSIAHYGNKKAFRFACAARYKFAGTLRIINRKAMPCKPDVPFK